MSASEDLPECSLSTQEGQAEAEAARRAAEILEQMKHVGFKLIYLDQNGEERVYDKFHYRLYNEAKLDKVCSWTSGHNNFGHYNNTLYVSATALWLVRNWQPTPPYSWQETEVYVLDDERDR